jgi:hypothetical protein
MGGSASYAVRFSDVIPSYDSAAKNPRQRAYLNQDPYGSSKCLPDKKLPQTSAPLSVFASRPLAGGHLAPHGNLCQAENIDILKGKLQVLEILVLRRLLCDTIPAQIP